ncbi:MAG TPA: tripartite tricarboxylate transporter substrate binding protein [Burkholderiales bacterium]|nr:tripartite tricarboxylate transporter substrate binding protein [Burkholderiales bacterium]
MKQTILFLLSSIFATGAFAQYPAKPIRLVVPFPAGESVDATARLVGQSWSAALGQQILVDNRGGAGGTIGSEAVARSAPDGYTLLWGNVGPLAIGPGLYKKLGYDVARDFEPVSLVATLPFVLFASPVLPANSVSELVAYAKAHPGEINFGSTGVGSGLHLIAELFKSVAGIQIVHVPYKGVAQALPEMMSGKVQIAFNTIPAFLPHVKAGRLKAIAITAASRSPLLPDVPAMTEVGLPGVLGGSWHAVVAPAGTPREVLAKLNRTLVATVANPELRTQLANQGAQAVGSSPDELRKFMQAEGEKWGRVIRSSGTRAD